MLAHNQPDILKRAQAFLPEFIQNTDKILSNPEMLKASQMDVKIKRSEDFNPATQEQEFRQQQQNSETATESGATVVNMVSNKESFDVLTILSAG